MGIRENLDDSHQSLYIQMMMGYQLATIDSVPPGYHSIDIRDRPTTQVSAGVVLFCLPLLKQGLNCNPF
jgi:hypothetical protein